MQKREWIDSQGVKWAVSLTAHSIRKALSELGANLGVCLTQRPEEFVLALFWYAVEDQARLNLLTREQIETRHIAPSDLFPDGGLMSLMDTLIREAIPERKDTAPVGETQAPESL